MVHIGPAGELLLISKIVHWFSTWNRPVTAAALENLQAASRAAAAALGEACSPQRHILYSTSRNLLIRPQGTFSPGLLLAAFLQGRPVAISLYQHRASGVIGPFGRTRKAARKGRIGKENALVFWRDGSETGKVMKAGIGETGQAREIRMLSMLTGLDGMVPVLLAHDPSLRWMVMEKIESGPSLSADRQAECYISQIAPRYFAFWGCRAKPVQRFLGSSLTPPHLEQEARHLGLTLADGWQNGLLDWSITHGGGICEEMMIRADGRACLLDWEKAALAPIAEDLLQVFEYYPSETLALFESLKTPHSLAIADQLALALCTRSIDNRGRKKPPTARLRSDRACAEHLASLQR